MGMFLVSNQQQIDVKYRTDLDKYALKFGKEGWIKCFDVSKKEIYYLKIRQLNFQLSTYAYWGKDCIVKDIPSLSSYQNAVLDHPYGYQLIKNGLKFNVFIDEVEHIEILDDKPELDFILTDSSLIGN